MKRHALVFWLSVGILVVTALTGRAAQFARPSGTVSAGVWAPFGAATLHEATDEVSANGDTDYAEAADNDTMELNLSTVTDPLSSAGHIVRFNANASGSKNPYVGWIQKLQW